MSKPTIEPINNGYRLAWGAERVEAFVTRMHQHKDGRVTAEILLKATEGANRHIAQRQLNLQSDQALKGLRVTCESVFDTGNWQTVIEQLAVYSIEAMRQGEPAYEVEADGEQEIFPPDYLLHPLLLKDRPVMIYGEGGSGKTLVGAITLAAVMLPWTNNTLGLDTNGTSHNVLVLDWENELEDWRRMLGMICQGNGLGIVGFRHRRCVMPLSQDMDAIQQIVTEHGIEYIIIDSVGEAAGGGEGNLSENQAALQLFRSLRSLQGVTPLLIHHTSKQQDKTKTPFGSVYFWNMCRSIWEVRASREPGSNELAIALFHRKANFSSQHSPLSYNLTFADNAIAIKQGNIGDIADFNALFTDKARILTALTSRALTVADIAQETGLAEASIRTQLNRLVKGDNAKVVKLNDKWGLKYNG